MGHNVRLFAGRPDVLGAYRAVLPVAELFELTSNAEFAVLPLDDDLHDALHRVYPAGEWRAGAVRLSDGDMAFAARASERGPLAYLETNYFGGAGFQAAALWKDGSLVLAPVVLNVIVHAGIPPSTWPINTALRLMGLATHEDKDEFDSFGLGFYRSNADIWAMARAVPKRA